MSAFAPVLREMPAADDTVPVTDNAVPSVKLKAPPAVNPASVAIALLLPRIETAPAADPTRFAAVI